MTAFREPPSIPLLSRYALDPIYAEKVDQRDRDWDDTCPDCGEPTPGFVCVPCCQKNRGRVEVVQWTPPTDAPAGFFPEDAVPPW